MTDDHRRAKKQGQFSLVLDFRANDPNKATDSAFWANADDLAVLLALLIEVCGADCEVFFDFGVITIRGVDLGVVAGKVKAGTPNG